MKKYQVGFYVSGHVIIEVQIPNNITAEQLQEGLNTGKFLTSITPGSPILQLQGDAVHNDFEHVGKVIELVEPDCEYNDFEVKEIPEENILEESVDNQD